MGAELARRAVSPALQEFIQGGIEGWAQSQMQPNRLRRCRTPAYR